MECEWQGWGGCGCGCGRSGAPGRLGRGSEVHPRPVPRTKDDFVQVLLGAHSLSIPEPYKRLYDVQSVVPHPGSGPDSVEDDLLLLRVRKLDPLYSESSLDPSFFTRIPVHHPSPTSDLFS